MGCVPILLIIFVAIVHRWFSSGHPPIMGTFESSLSNAFVFLLLFCALPSSRKYLKENSSTALLIALLMILSGVFKYIPPIPLTISERSLWVDFHALFGFLTFGFYGLSLISAFRKDEVYEELFFKFVFLGFISQTILMALGSYYSFLLFGRFISWDFVENACMISFITIGLAIHLKLVNNWKHKKFRNIVLIGFFFYLLSIRLAAYFPYPTSYHIFDVRF